MGQSVGGVSIVLALMVCVSLGSCVFGHPGELHSDEITLDRVQIFVNFVNGTNFTLMVEPDDKVHDLLEDIKEYEGVPGHRMQVFLDDVRLEHETRLADYNIQAGTTLTLVVPEVRGHYTTQFTVKTHDGRRELPVQCQLSNSVSSLKDNIARWAGVARKQQRLLLSGKELKDDRRLIHYAIQNGTTINLGTPLEECQQAVTIFVKTLSDTTVGVEVNLADTVTDLKEKIWRKTGVPVGVQRLNANERVITGEDHLCDLGLESGSTVYMFLYSARITSLEQVAKLQIPNTAYPVNPGRNPIFREAEDASEPVQGASLYKDTRNWDDRFGVRPGWELKLFDPVAHLAPNPDDKDSLEQYCQHLKMASDPNAAEWYVREARINRARIELSLAVRPYRVVANLTSITSSRQHPGITLGGGSTEVGPEQLVPLGADINNWAPDGFSDSDVMRLFQVANRVRQVLAKAAQRGGGILSIENQRRINRAILLTYLEVLAGYLPPVETNQTQPGGDEECGICRDDITAEPAIELPCEHKYHADCIRSWVINTHQRGLVSTCPFCRQNFMFAYEALGKAELETPEMRGEQDE